MTTDEKDLLKRLLREERIAAVSVIVEGSPYVGGLPFVAGTALDALLIHASDLARHSKGLGEGRPYSALISLPDSPALDPLQIPRLTISGKSARLEKSSPQYAAGQAVYLDKFPGAAMTFGLGDFHLYRLAIEKARFVLGFGRALNVGLETLRGL